MIFSLEPEPSRSSVSRTFHTISQLSSSLYKHTPHFSSTIHKSELTFYHFQNSISCSSSFPSHVTTTAMASSLALKRFLSSNLLSKSFRPVAHPAISSRFFNSNAIRDYESDDRDLETERRIDRRVFSPFAEVFDPFVARSSLSQILNAMDQMMESPVATAIRRNWEAKETIDGLHLRLDMPGLGKEDVKVSVEQNTLIIKGEGKKEFEEDDESGRRYTSRIDLPEKLYKTDGIKGEMKNGVLKLFVPKIKEEERKDVFHVNVE